MTTLRLVLTALYLLVLRTMSSAYSLWVWEAPRKAGLTYGWLDGYSWKLRLLLRILQCSLTIHFGVDFAIAQDSIPHLGEILGQ